MVGFLAFLIILCCVLPFVALYLLLKLINYLNYKYELRQAYKRYKKACQDSKYTIDDIDWVLDSFRKGIK